MRIAIGADHGGYELKQQIADFLIAQGHQVQDFGTHSPESVDYPDFAAPLARAVVAGEFERGILICGTGIGMSIAANKVRGARAALCTDCYMAHMSRQDNDANILCLGGRVLGLGLALDIVQVFLNSEFLGGHHTRRIGKIRALDDERG
ncbi:MAG TPA: ribose 5-phosphate isomerase B [Thermoflexia bacterium]|nr:MAG: ribose 5-phosphate isomerase B [Chloroflexota bacterium]HEY66735.1 ribose 5-phosphate isomerase B [Thermoflexia bacterium]